MISKANLEAITDKIGQQVYNLRNYLGEPVTSLVGSPATICESLYDLVDDLITAGDKASLSAIQTASENAINRIDWETIASNTYAGWVRRLNQYLLDGESVSYNGFSKFAIDNDGTRYCSEFCRLLKLLGYTLLTDSMCFYDQDDIIGTYVVSASGQGTYTPSSTDIWDDYADIYGVQPSSSIQVVPKTVIGVANIDITINCTNINGDATTVSGTVTNGTPIGTAKLMAGDYYEYIVSVNNVRISGGTVGDEFYVRMSPIRSISL